MDGKKLKNLIKNMICKVHSTMTCLVDSVLSGAGMKLHTSMLVVEDHFYINLGTMYANFQEKISTKIFLENRHTWCQGVYENGPQQRSM